MIIVAIIISSLFVVAGFAVPIWAGHRFRHYDASLRDVELASGAAKRLMEDDNVPESIIAFIKEFSPEMSRPRAARALVAHVLSGRFERSTSLGPGPIGILFNKLTGARKRDFAIFVVHTVLMSASSSRFLAWFYRRILLWGVMVNTEADLTNEIRGVQIAEDMAAKKSHTWFPFANAA